MRSIPFLLLVSGCFGTDDLADYYATWDPPSVSALSQSSEKGNLGGATISITGSGFGSDLSTVVVQFGDHTAEIESLSDGEIVVVVPPGPMSGGEVRVRVATATGYADTTYTYDIGVSADQVGYIQVNNYFESCLGGTSTSGCLGWVGGTGTDGYAEQLSFAYPNLQAPTQGFLGGQDFGYDEWQVQKPGSSTYPFATEDLRVDMGDKIVLTNRENSSDNWCVEVDSTAVYYYGGGEEGFLDPVSAQATSVPDTNERSGACRDGEREYNPQTLEMCQRDNVYGVPTYQYRADWPITESFFDGGRSTDPVAVTLDADGLEGLKLNLPEPLLASNTKGIDTDNPADWGVAGLYDPGALNHCFAEEGEPELLDDVALRFEWTPSEVELATGDGILGSRVFVRFSMRVLSYGWFGGIDYPAAAVITVEDAHDVDDETGNSVLEIPSSVLYQFPTTVLPFSADLWVAQPTDGVFWWEIQRVTEYTLQREDGKIVVFQYVTGDGTYLDWRNPTEAGSCYDCLDDDGDGWSDVEDPDCSGDVGAESGLGSSICNDGVDNDGDGLGDAEDPDCEDATDDDEANCDDNDDNDGDGYEDEDDPDCALYGNELIVQTCDDNDDNDLDGWEDEDDPDCASGYDELGFGSSACNDGLDNDGDGVADGSDAECADASDTDESNCDDGVDNDGDGATDEADAECLAGGYESSEPLGACEDLADNDLDGWVDVDDPDCTSGSEEIGFGTTACNDGTDNDGDLVVDGLDPGCSSASDEDESDG